MAAVLVSRLAAPPSVQALAFVQVGFHFWVQLSVQARSSLLSAAEEPFAPALSVQAWASVPFESVVPDAIPVRAHALAHCSVAPSALPARNGAEVEVLTPAASAALRAHAQRVQPVVAGAH